MNTGRTVIASGGCISSSTTIALYLYSFYFMLVSHILHESWEMTYHETVVSTHPRRNPSKMFEDSYLLSISNRET